MPSKFDAIASRGALRILDTYGVAATFHNVAANTDTDCTVAIFRTIGMTPFDYAGTPLPGRAPTPTNELYIKCGVLSDTPKVNDYFVVVTLPTDITGKKYIVRSIIEQDIFIKMDVLEKDVTI